MGRLSIWVLLGLALFAVSSNDIFASADVSPSESECRPYIEKAIHELKTGDPHEKDTDKDSVASPEAASGEDTTSKEPEHDDNDDSAEPAQADDAAAEQAESEQDDNDNQGEDNDDDNDNDDGKDDSEDAKDDSKEESKDQLETAEISDAESQEVAKSAEDTTEADDGDDKKSEEADDDGAKSEEQADESDDNKSAEEKEEASSKEGSAADEADDDVKSGEAAEASKEEEDAKESEEKQTEEDKAESAEAATAGDSKEEETDKSEGASAEEADEETISRTKREVEETAPEDSTPEDDDKDSKEEAAPDGDDGEDSKEEPADDGKDSKEATEEDGADSKEEAAAESKEEAAPESKEDDKADDDDDDDASKADDDKKADDDDSKAEDEASKEEPEAESKEAEKDEADDGKDSKEDSKPEEDDGDSKEAAPADEAKESEEGDSKAEGSAEGDETDDGKESEEDDTKPEDELLWEGEIPENLRSRNHITELLQLDEDFEARGKAVDRVAEIILRDIKRIYENAIKPLETLYKYRDLSNRHFGDPEIFSKPMVLFMGPWSGGKSSIINYLTGNEYTPHSLRTGAEPSPAYFNILTWGNETEVLDGTQLAADYTFSGLQKFGEGLEERLRGLKLPSKLLEKVNIVEIPGILEVRKQVSRLFPFNDACQWFIDRADIIFLVYDPAKLDVGPETEAILDQLKGREYQTRIVLNKADTVKPEELLRVQSALIWNISPLMSSAQPPLMYTTSLWSHPYQDGSPARLLQAQERAFLRDMRTAIDKRIEHKISSARRFAVRVRNHAKMVDCYLTTYFNHKTLFGNKKRIADDIIDHPQNYHIYEGLSTLTNISRYDLPDPEVYRDFFRLNPLYEFKKLADTCTYFRGCPISKLDVAIAYDLPELAGKYKKMAESALTSLENQKSRS